MKFVTMPDPFRGAPVEVRRKVVLEVATEPYRDLRRANYVSQATAACS